MLRALERPGFRRFSTSLRRLDESDILRQVLGHVLATKKPKDEGIVPLFGSWQQPAKTRQTNVGFRQGAKSSLLKSVHSKESLVHASQMQSKGRDLLFDVLAHINSLDTNTAVINYYTSVILPRHGSSTDSSSSSASASVLARCSVDAPAVDALTAPILLSECMRVLRTEFRDVTGALHLFTVAKMRSLPCFTDSCTAAVYNQVIAVKWRDFGSLPAVLDVISEMTLNAVKPDLETVDLLAEISAEAESSAHVSAKHMHKLNEYHTRFQIMWASKPSQWSQPDV